MPIANILHKSSWEYLQLFKTIFTSRTSLKIHSFSDRFHSSGNEFAPREANSFLYELDLFEKGGKKGKQ